MLSRKKLARILMESITPFVEEKVDFPSRGFGHCGYDVTLSTEFWVPKEGVIFDPLQPNQEHFEKVESPGPFVIQPNSWVLGITVEYIRMPRNLVGICLGKSTYARLGLLVNATPLEPSWDGRLVLELANLGRNALVVHPGKGIAQILFFHVKGAPPYEGRYQYQSRIQVP